MHIKIVPFTEKHPFLYQIYMIGYIIETTNKEKHERLLEFLTQYCSAGYYADLPISRRMKIECEFTVKKTA